MTITSEHQRFLTLYKRMIEHMGLWIERTPADKLDWMPIETSAMRFGDRVSRITVKGLVVHTVVGEHHWSEFLLACEDGATMPPPKGSPLTAKFEADGFGQTTRKYQAETFENFGKLDAAQLAKSVVWSGRTWSVMGFLWGVYAHRAFHLGNIDTYLRQADVVAPEFFQFNPVQMA